MNNKAILIAVLLAGSAGFAAPAPPPAQPASFICGGISQPESEALKAQAHGHDLMVTFAEVSGAYLSDVDFRISDRRGQVVLSGTCEGPLMLVDLPAAGTWRVTAHVNGLTREQTVTTVRGRTARATLVWPASD